MAPCRQSRATAQVLRPLKLAVAAGAISASAGEPRKKSKSRVGKFRARKSASRRSVSPGNVAASRGAAKCAPCRYWEKWNRRKPGRSTNGPSARSAPVVAASRATVAILRAIRAARMLEMRPRLQKNQLPPWPLRLEPRRVGNKRSPGWRSEKRPESWRANLDLETTDNEHSGGNNTARRNHHDLAIASNRHSRGNSIYFGFYSRPWYT